MIFEINVFGLNAKDITLKINTNKTKKITKNKIKKNVSANKIELFIFKTSIGNCLNPQAKAKEEIQIMKEKISFKTPLKNPLKLKIANKIKKTTSNIEKVIMLIIYIRKL